MELESVCENIATVSDSSENAVQPTDPLSVPNTLNCVKTNDANVLLLADELAGIDLSNDISNPEESDSPPTKLPKTPTKITQSRNSRSVRGLKRPQPQPHVCVLDKTTDGRLVFINVLSWTKIIKPKHPLEPIPLFGGVRIVSSNPLYKSLLIYAVTANPVVLTKTKRNGGNTQAQYALMLLMTDFVEAMNPGLKLKRQPELLLDRDLTGELKEIWLTLKSKREKDKFAAMTEETPNIFYEEFGPIDGQPTSIAIDNNESPVQITLSPSQDDKPTEIIESVNPPPPYESLKIHETITTEINFSINPYLVPYPEQEPKINAVPDIDLPQTIESVETITIKAENNNSQITKPVLPNHIDLTVTDSVNNEKLQIQSPTVAATPITTSTMEETSKAPSNNQQLESIKKSLEFFTNGCHNFFLFKSKNSNNQHDNANNTGKKKEPKDKHSKSANKMIKCNSKNTSAVAANGVNNENAIDNQSDKSDILKGKICNADDEKEFAIKT